MSASATTSVKLDPEIRARVQRLAASRRRSAHWILLEAVRQYVEREETLESFRRGAIAAWDDYQSTGLHVTAAEADTWLARLEAGDEVAPPECHE